MALAQREDLAEAVDRFRQGLEASALCHHHENLQVRQAACGPLQVEVEGVRWMLRLPTQVLTGFPGSAPHLRFEVGRVEDRQTRQDDRANAAQTSHHVARLRDSVASPTSPG